jgi:glycosyltransferase involved in cell wall biosynthesis
MTSIIVHAAGDPDLLAETIRRAICGISEARELVVVGTVGDLPTRIGPSRHAEQIVWIDRPGIGRAAAVNEGLARTQGEIIATLSAGDFHFEDTLRIVADAADRHPFAECFYGDAMLADATGRPFAEFNAPARSKRRGYRHLRLCPAATFIRRRAIEQVGLLDPGLRYWADYELWLRLERAGAEFKQIPRLLAGRRTGTRDPAPSDFTLLPGRESLDELMQVRLNRWTWRLSGSKLAWYGVARATAGASGDRARVGFGDAMRHALEAHRRWGDGQPMRPSRRLAVAAKIARLSVGGRFLQEFEVTPLRQMEIRRFQSLRRKVFRLRNHAPRPLSLPRHYARPRILSAPPTISIVTPSFNQGHVLEETIRSVLDQRYPALEYIVQDGGSTDGSVDVLQRYGSQLTYWESAADGGQSAAINLGMRRTTGEIMAYLNSDDLLLPGSLAYVAEYFQSHPEVDVVYGHRVLIDENSQEIGRWVLPPHDARTIMFADFIPQETMFWRRRAWEAVGGSIDESFRFAMDWDLILRFRAAGLTFRRLPRFLGGFRVWKDQKSLSWWLPVGRRETERLTTRTLGVAPTRECIRREIAAYVRRHWVLDKLYLAGLVRY